MQFRTGDGLRLAYSDTYPSGDGRPTIVLVHGWCSSRADLAPLAAALAGSHRVVTLDLPGHGESDAPADGSRLSVPALARDVAALCAHLGLRSVVAGGHSSGAAVAAALAARRPELVAALVSIDGTLLFPQAVLDGVAPLLAALHTDGWRDAMRGFLSAAYLPSDDPALLSAELAALERMSHETVAAVPEQVVAWDAAGDLRAVGASGLPVLHVDASAMTDLDRVRAWVPQLAVAVTAGVGHVQLVGHPAQAAAIVTDFLRASIGGARSAEDAVRALFDVLGHGDLDRLDDLVSADFVDHGAPPGLVPPGPEGYRATVGLLRRALQLTWEPLAVVAQGEHVMVRVRNRGRHVGELFGIPPTGRELDVEAMHHYRVAAGVLREHHAVRDDLTLFRQLGLMPEDVGPVPAGR